MTWTCSLGFGCSYDPTGALVEEGLDIMEAGRDGHGVDAIASWRAGAMVPVIIACALVLHRRIGESRPNRRQPLLFVALFALKSIRWCWCAAITSKGECPAGRGSRGVVPMPSGCPAWTASDRVGFLDARLDMNSWAIIAQRHVTMPPVHPRTSLVVGQPNSDFVSLTPVRPRSADGQLAPVPPVAHPRQHWSGVTDLAIRPRLLNDQQRPSLGVLLLTIPEPSATLHGANAEEARRRVPYIDGGPGIVRAARQPTLRR